MTKNKQRFVVETDENFQISIKDKGSDNYLFSICCGNVDDYVTILAEVENTVIQLNRLWEQILRFDKYNDEKANLLGKIDNIVTKTNLESHSECWNALIKIDVITNGYGDVE